MGKSSCTLCRYMSCHYEWFNKQADWPIAAQDKVKWASQTEDDRMRKSRVRGVTSQMENESDTQNGREEKATSLGVAHRLIEKG